MAPRPTDADEPHEPALPSASGDWPEPDPSIGSELESLRLRHRMVRLERALRELRRQADLHRTDHADTPAGLIRAMRDFELELAAARAALSRDVSGEE